MRAGSLIELQQLRFRVAVTVGEAANATKLQLNSKRSLVLTPLLLAIGAMLGVAAAKIDL